ncbi:MAG: hypothetical protein QNJ22_10535 [Desulfosarcinaceae bacterium]|nr:hypothetical protein [Desulfosarcinaceae bacterium]
MNALIMDLMVAERRAETQREFQRRRLLAQFDALRADIRRKAWRRRWNVLGEFLIRTGERIKSRYGIREPMTAHTPRDKFYSCL